MCAVIEKVILRKISDLQVWVIPK